MFIGYHASHEQFSPRELLDLLPYIESAGFNGVMSSDHISPWSKKQGESGFVWSWLGAALEKSALPFGSLAIPGGWRLHPAALAQAICTLCQMYPDRLRWVAAGSGEYLNEHVAGEPWPDKATRNKRLLEGVEILRALFNGHEVSKSDGLITIDRAKIWSLPRTPPKIYAAALTDETARWAGSWADGLITVMKPPGELAKTIEAFRQGGGEGKPVILQMQLSWAPRKEDAIANAMDQWRMASLSGEDCANLATPEEFEAACADAQKNEIQENMLISNTAEDFISWIREYPSLGVAEIYLHNVGRNQQEFIEFFSRHVLSQLSQKD